MNKKIKLISLIAILALIIFLPRNYVYAKEKNNYIPNTGYIEKNNINVGIQIMDLKATNNDCDIITPELRDLLNQYMKWIRILVPIALIGFGVVDFLTAMTSAKEDEMKKSTQRFIRRVIAAILIFLAPILVNILFDLINKTGGTNYTTCGIK